MPAPADHDVRPYARHQQPRVAQHAIDRVGDALRLAQLEAAVLVDLAVDVQDVAQHREEVLLDAADHAPVDECTRGRVVQLELHAPGLAQDGDLEVGVAVENRPRVVRLAAAVEHGERAAPVDRVEAAARGVEQPVDLELREVLEAAGRRHPGVDRVGVLHRRDGDLDLAHHYGRISIGIPACVRSQMSTMSALLTAMQPSVQSLRA
jgi:hypothetical protein